MQRQGLRYLMYREVVLRQRDLLDQVRTAALNPMVDWERLTQFFPDLTNDRGGLMAQVMSPEDAVAVAEVDDDFEGTTVFEMEPETAIAIMREMGMRVPLDELEANSGNGSS